MPYHVVDDGRVVEKLRDQFSGRRISTLPTPRMLGVVKPNLRAAAYFALFALRGQPVGRYYRRMLQEDRNGIPPNTMATQLTHLLEHCERHVPYYAELMREAGGSYLGDPERYLTRLPVLTKGIIRARSDDLKSSDLQSRKWYFNTSSGSTGSRSF
jgi:phenylacetate-CoA ligase